MAQFIERPENKSSQSLTLTAKLELHARVQMIALVKEVSLSRYLIKEHQSRKNVYRGMVGTMCVIIMPQIIFIFLLSLAEKCKKKNRQQRRGEKTVFLIPFRAQKAN